MAKDQDIDGHPVGKDDVDGIPIDDQDNNLDGFPLSKAADIDIDGIPFGGDIDGAPSMHVFVFFCFTLPLLWLLPSI